MLHFRTLVLLVLISSCCAGCGYHLTGRAVRPFSRGSSVWVPFILNESVSPSAQTVIRRVLYEELYSLRGLVPAETKDSAEVIASGRVTSYSSRAISYSSQDRAREFRLSVELEMELYMKERGVPVWKGQLRGEQDYPANSDLALQRNAEESALDAAARKIAHKFISATEQNY